MTGVAKRLAQSARAPGRRSRVAIVAAALAAGFPVHACVPIGEWAIPLARGAQTVSAAEVLEKARLRRVVLLGESHESPEHHRWQLHTVAALQAQRPRLVLAFEMFPRSVQPVLDRWVDGELDENAFLEASRWTEVWGYEAAQYLQLFQFARMHRVPMLALNVEREVVRRVAREGFDAVPLELREGVGRPAPASPAYLQELHSAYVQHAGSQDIGMDDPAFARFVAGQQTWDRAMAEAIAGALVRFPERQVVAILGRGHTGPGAVPHQLQALGIADIAVLLPWDRAPDCRPPQPGVADAVFGVAAGEEKGFRPRLGIALSRVDAGVRVDQVVEGSVAAQAGLRPGDLLVTVAGKRVSRNQDVLDTVARQAPGTWLPLGVRREGAELELVAKFPR